MTYRTIKALTILGAVTTMPVAAHSKIVDLTVTVENLAATDSISFAPLRFGFNQGTFDAFDNGETATAPIISVAEGGSGVDWFPAFAAADPGAVLGSTDGPLTPGSTFTTSAFRIDTSVNPFFTFGSMVVPSNDFFIGNDDPMEYRLFDDDGNLLIFEIGQIAADIWNAGSEAFDPINAAFLAIGTNALRTPEGGVVGFNFAELAGFDGLETAAGYILTSGLSADDPIYRISFAATDVPEPGALGMFAAGSAMMGFVAYRRRRDERPASSAV